MNKPFFTAVACLLLSSALAMGQMPFQFINLVKVPNTTVPVSPTPSIDPLSVVEMPVEVVSVGDNVIVTILNDISDIEIIVVGSNGVVYSQKHNIFAGEDIIVPTTDWEKDNYSIYIVIGEDVYVGNFEKLQNTN